MDDRQLAERAQVQLLVALLLLQAGQGQAQLIKGANGRRRLGGLTRRPTTPVDEYSFL